jgi:hypothetical protein
MVPVSLWVSLVAEGIVCPREPWIVAFEHECQNPVFIPALPETHIWTREYESV